MSSPMSAPGAAPTASTPRQPMEDTNMPWSASITMTAEAPDASNRPYVLPLPIPASSIDAYADRMVRAHTDAADDDEHDDEREARHDGARPERGSCQEEPEPDEAPPAHTVGQRAHDHGGDSGHAQVGGNDSPRRRVVEAELLQHERKHGRKDEPVDVVRAVAQIAEDEERRGAHGTGCSRARGDRGMPMYTQGMPREAGDLNPCCDPRADPTRKPRRSADEGEAPSPDLRRSILSGSSRTWMFFSWVGSTVPFLGPSARRRYLTRV